jgi:hypothetical protein
MKRDELLDAVLDLSAVCRCQVMMVSFDRHEAGW